MGNTKFVIDIGTNSVRLMKAAVENKTVRCVYKKLRTVRTGEGVNASGRLSEGAIERTLGALREYREIIDHSEKSDVFCFATSAVRDSSNAAYFVRRVREECGMQVRILSGDEEARYGFVGAVGKKDGGIIDIGGGSTEIIFGRDGQIEYARSFNIGCVRGLEMFDGCAGATVDWAIESLKEVPFEKTSGVPFYSIGGTASALAAVDLQLAEYDSRKVDGYILTSERSREMFGWLSAKTVEERREIIGMDRARADVIVFGLAILVAFFRVSGKENVIVSESDNLEGFLMCNL